MHTPNTHTHTIKLLQLGHKIFTKYIKLEKRLYFIAKCDSTYSLDYFSLLENIAVGWITKQAAVLLSVLSEIHCTRCTPYICMQTM